MAAVTSRENAQLTFALYAYEYHRRHVDGRKQNSSFCSYFAALLSVSLERQPAPVGKGKGIGYKEL